jgi:hypothetical protein
MTDTPTQINGDTPISVELTAQDAQLICQMADLVVRAQGLQSAKAALYISEKFDVALAALAALAKQETPE